MKIRYDAEVDALYIQFSATQPVAAETREVSESLFLDYDANGHLLGIEILDASSLSDFDRDQLTVELGPLKKRAA